MVMHQPQKSVQAFELLTGVNWWGIHLLSLCTFFRRWEYKRIFSSLMAKLSANISHIWAESSLTAAYNSSSIMRMADLVVRHLSTTHRRLQNFLSHFWVVRVLTHPSEKAWHIFFYRVHSICYKFKLMQHTCSNNTVWSTLVHIHFSTFMR